MILQIFKDRMHDNIIVDIVLKLWVGGLLSLFVLGMGQILYAILSGDVNLDNVTFGVFDTLGN